MNPGLACLACHRQSREGPRFVLSGTVFGKVNEADGCLGAPEGVSVVVTDANNHVITLTPNAAGNFFSQAAVVAPYRVTLRFAGGEKQMATPQTDGDCNACHTAAGASGAPGRIFVP